MNWPDGYLYRPVREVGALARRWRELSDPPFSQWIAASAMSTHSETEPRRSQQWIDRVDRKVVIQSRAIMGCPTLIQSKEFSSVAAILRLIKVSH